METKNNIKESEFNARSFKIVYITLFVVILIFDIIIIVSLFTVWAKLEIIVYVFTESFGQPPFSFGIFLYYLFLFSPIVKVGFEIYEVVRFTRFLKSSDQDKENAINVAKGFKGTRIYRIYYLILMAGLIIWMEILEVTSKGAIVSDPYYTSFLKFYWWFAILLFIHILPIIVGPEIIKFSIDYTNKKTKTKIILDIILWTIILILVLNIDFFIALINLIRSRM